jgi:hypothetical protein
LWLTALVTPQVQMVENIVTVGLLFFFLGMLFFLRSAAQHVSTSSRRFILILTMVYILVLILIRSNYPVDSNQVNSVLFYFNQHPLVVFLEIILVTAILAASSLSMFHDIRVKDRLSANVFYIAILTIRIGCLFVLAGVNDYLLMLDGIALSVAFFLLLLTSVGFFGHRSVRGLAIYLHILFHRTIAPWLESLKRSALPVKAR